MREQQGEPGSLAPLLLLRKAMETRKTRLPPARHGPPRLPGDDELVDHGLCKALRAKALQAIAVL